MPVLKVNFGYNDRKLGFPEKASNNDMKIAIFKYIRMYCIQTKFPGQFRFFVLYNVILEVINFCASVCFYVLCLFIQSDYTWTIFIISSQSE